MIVNEGPRPSVSPRRALWIGLGIVTAFLAVTLGAMPHVSYDVWAAIIVGPALFALTLPLLSRQSRRERDRRFFWLLVLALALKLGAGIAADYVAFDVYGGAADAAEYHR